MNPTVLADPTAAPESETPSQPVTGRGPATNGSAPAGPGDTATSGGSTPTPEPGTSEATGVHPHACVNCEAALDDGQDWCLQCGAAAPGSLDAGGPSWRSATVVLTTTVALVLGAAAAAYAALTQPSAHKPAPRVVTVAQAPVTTAPLPTTPGTATTPGAAAPNGVGTPTTINPLPSTANPPKIPLTAPTPKSSGTPSNTSSQGTGNTGSGTGESGTGSNGANEPANKSGGTTTTEQTPILLDTNAASTYNPYNYPASNFGDPRQAIDGEPGTGWTALVDPAVAPKMAEGIAIDLKTPRKVAALTLITSTPGMTVQVYGSAGHALPGSITDPAWVALSPSQDAKKRKTKISLRDSGKALRFFTLWISRAPASAVGTAAAPGRVSVNELKLFAAK